MLFIAIKTTSYFFLLLQFLPPSWNHLFWYVDFSNCLLSRFQIRYHTSPNTYDFIHSNISLMFVMYLFTSKWLWKISFGCKVVITLYSAHEGEYQSLESFLSTNGNSHFTSSLHIPEHKSFSEWQHSHSPQPFTLPKPSSPNPPEPDPPIPSTTYPTNTHKMITRAKNKIQKPIQKLNLMAQITPLKDLEPTT